jgi:hypothetical protein
MTDDGQAPCAKGSCGHSQQGFLSLKIQGEGIASSSYACRASYTHSCYCLSRGARLHSETRGRPIIPGYTCFSAAIYLAPARFKGFSARPHFFSAEKCPRHSIAFIKRHAQLCACDLRSFSSLHIATTYFIEHRHLQDPRTDCCTSWRTTTTKVTTLETRTQAYEPLMTS